MKVVVAGGSGFLGAPLVQRLASLGHDLVVLTRSPRRGHERAAAVRDVSWNPGAAAVTSREEWAREIDGAGAVINLAGAGIADKRWSAARKREIRDSRTLATRALADAVRAASARPGVFVQGSAVGFYGASLADTVFDESCPPGNDFLGQTCVAWEAEAHPVASLGCRLVILRTGISLAADGGPLVEMKRPFSFFVGGPIGSGRQYISWIHRDDWIALVIWVLTTAGLQGVLNASAPEPVTNARFSKALGRALHRPSWLPVPRIALRIAFGELAELLVLGQRVVPARAQAAGFAFKYPQIEGALENLLSPPT